MLKPEPAETVYKNVMPVLRSGFCVLGLLLSLLTTGFANAWGPHSRAVALYPGSNMEGVTLPLEDAFRSLGVPYYTVSQLQEALNAPLVFVCGDVESNEIATSYEKTLQPYVENGGVVVFEKVTASALDKLAGISGATPLRTRHRMTFATSVLPERTASLGSVESPEVVWTVGYSPAGADVLAEFEDGSAALLRHKVGKGFVYTIGVGWMDAILRPRQNRDFEAQRTYVNALDFSTDLFLLTLRDLFWKHAPNACRLYSLPAGALGVVILTHDIDWEGSVRPARSFVLAEKKRGLRGTFFVQAKTIKDYNGPPILTNAAKIQLSAMLEEGADIESHSVAHSLWFNNMPAGTGVERSETYVPTAKSYRIITGASISGEVCVSKQRLDEAFSRKVVIFRAGHLRVPPSLPETLEKCGYSGDSSFTAADVMTSLPYRLNKGLGFTEPTNIFEFPVTVEDERWKLEEHTQDVLKLVQVQGSMIGAPTVVLIHPTNATTKLQAETRILAALPSNVPATDLKTFMNFYIARWNIDWNDGPDGDLRLCSREGIRGLMLRTKEGDQVLDIWPGECHSISQPPATAQ